MRLIDADAIVYTHAIARSIDDGHNWNELCVTKDEIDDMPSAEPERKKGRWIKVGHWGRSYKCNQCGNYLDFDGVNAGRGDVNFCPNCGADMRQREE